MIIYVDGGARGNPGPAGAGVVITSDDGRRIHEGAYFLGQQTNNAAEYHALIRALQRIGESGQETLTICSDSELLVRQLTGQYRVKSPKLASLFEQVQLLLLRTPCWSIRHIPRELNQHADELANRAMDLGRDDIVFDADARPSVQDAPPSPADNPDAPSRQPTSKPNRPVSAPDVAAHEVAVPETDLPRTVRVTVARAPKPDGCPACETLPESFTVQSTLPAGLCIHAAHALLPTILAALNTEPGEFAALPTLTVRCMRPGCGATFHVSPERSSNGAGRSDKAS